MRNEMPEFEELTPEMIEHYMAQARRMRAQAAQNIVKTLFSSISRVVEKIATATVIAARTAYATVGKTGKLRAADPA